MTRQPKANLISGPTGTLQLSDLMTNEKQLIHAAIKSRVQEERRMKTRCMQCGSSACHCMTQPDAKQIKITPEEVCYIIDCVLEEKQFLNEEQSKALIEACLAALPEIFSESHLKLIINTCILEAQKNQLSCEDIKLMIEGCVRTNQEINELILIKLNENPAGFLNQNSAKLLIDSCIAEIVFPPGVSDDHIKAQALACFMSLDLLDENAVKLIFHDLFKEHSLTQEDIKCEFEKCLMEWGIAPAHIKKFIIDQIICNLPKAMQNQNPEVLKFCFSFDSDRTFQPDSDGKVELPLALQVEQWDGGFVNALYSSSSQALQAPYAGPSKADITNCIQGYLSQLQPGLSKTDVETCVELALCKLELGLNKEEVQLCVQTALNGLNLGLSKAQVQLCVDTAIANLQLGLNKTQVQACISEQLNSLSLGLNKTQVQACVDATVANLQLGLNKAQVQACVDSTVQNLQLGLNKTEVQACVDATVQNLQLGLNKTEVQACIDQAIQDLQPGLSKTEVETCIQDALTELGPIFTQAQIEAISTTVANSIVQNAIQGLPGCITSAQANKVGNVVTVVIQQENCANTEFSFAVGEDGAIQCCNNGLTILKSGDDYTIELSQTNGPTLTETFSVTHPAQTPYCIQSLSLTYGAAGLTASLQQENCPGVVSAPLALPTFCITGAAVEQVGQVVTVGLTQENCPDTIEFSFTAGSGSGSVECCNTAAVGSVDVDNKTASIVISQSVGADVEATLDLEPLLNSLVQTSVQTDADGCSLFRSLVFCGVELGPFPVYEPKTDCKCVIVPHGFTGEVRIRIVETGTTQSVDWGDGATDTSASGNFFVHNYATATSATNGDSRRVITLCNEDACADFVFTLEVQSTPEAEFTCTSCGCC